MSPARRHTPVGGLLARRPRVAVSSIAGSAGAVIALAVLPVAAIALLTVASTIAMIAMPTNGRVGPLQLVVLGGVSALSTSLLPAEARLRS